MRFSGFLATQTSWEIKTQISLQKKKNNLKQNVITNLKNFEEKNGKKCQSISR